MFRTKGPNEEDKEMEKTKDVIKMVIHLTFSLFRQYLHE